MIERQGSHPLTLFELNALVSEVISTAFTSAYWVEAELSEAREVRGHCYMELIQKDVFGAAPVARASAKCWKSAWAFLRPRFEKVTGQPLHAGMKVLLCVTPQFHEAYGFSWIVQDIDPTYTMGDMARKRQEIIQQLHAEGIFDLQRELPIPAFAQHVAVISSENAAGYGDFCNQLRNNAYGFAFHVTLFPAVMQGDQVEPTIIAALNDIHREADNFDVVVIIRGGGATADLSGFDTLLLAENVANFPLPIITGIGHERDESILDMVSNTRVKTPTAAAALLIDHLAITWTRIANAQERMIGGARARMEREKARFDRSAGRIPILFSLIKTRQEARIDRLATQIATGISAQLNKGTYRIDSLSARLSQQSERTLTQARHRIEQLELRLKGVDPQVMLSRGYSITYHQGRVVRDASRLQSGDEIETRVGKGSVTSIVK